MIKVDLHTHSMISHDGGITEDEYHLVIEKRILDQIAITDHNKIEFALHMNKIYPSSFIVGEEIKTKDGEVIGLFLKRLIPPGLSLFDTIMSIKDQGGIIYIPHPYDLRRSGIGSRLYKYLDHIDILEIFNARTIGQKDLDDQKRSEILDKDISFGFGSDSHGISEIGRTYSMVDNTLTSDNIKGELSRSYENGEYRTAKANFRGLLNPTINRFMKQLRLRE